MSGRRCSIISFQILIYKSQRNDMSFANELFYSIDCPSEQLNKTIRLYYTSLKFLLPSIIIYMKQNDVHKVIILYPYARGRKGGETTSGGETTRGETTRGETSGGETTRG